MRHAAATWPLGLAISVLVHAGGAAALLLSLVPDPPQQQPAPQSRLNLEAHRVPRSTAVPQAAKGPQARESRAQGQRLASERIPRSNAAASAPQSQALAPTPPPTSPLASARAESDAALSVPAAGRRIVGVAASSQHVRPARPRPKPARVSPATATALPEAVTVAQPTAQAVAKPVPLAPVLAALRPQPAAAPELTTATAATPTAASLPASAPSLQVASAAIPDAPRIKAALAFQGGGEDIDPVSLAAFQSFMQTGDATTGGDPLRDGVSGILGAVPCARLQASFVPETATLEIRGHLPEDSLRTPVLAALQTQMGDDIAVSDKMRLLPRPQCGALAGIATIGLPQSTDQMTNPLLIGDDAHARVLDYSGGDRLFFDLTAPDYAAYVYVDYFDAEGTVLHLRPTGSEPMALSPAKSALRVGTRAPGDPGLNLTIGPPYGQEIAVAFAASHPLYGSRRPLTEPAGPYLDFLRARVAETRAKHPDFKGEWVYFLITTRAPRDAD